MDTDYDCVVLGTGLKESILSGLMSCDRKKVLHIDRNPYYGAESASLTLQQLYERFHPGVAPPAAFGRSRDYMIDLIPKFVMANGALVKLLVHTGVNRYMEFKVVDGSYVAREKKVHKVPVTVAEGLKSSLMGFFEKRRFSKFVEHVAQYEIDDPSTYKGIDIRAQTPEQIFQHFGLEAETVEFIGHAVALYFEDSYLKRPATELYQRCKLYADSLAKYQKSPYLYPLYGLGELPQGFSRLSAVWGGTYMVGRRVEGLVYGDDGRVKAVRAQGDDDQVHEVACKFVICDPSYAPEKVRKTGQVVRCICILSHPIPNTNDSTSCQIIIPYRQARRSSDIYISCVSADHNVAAAGKWVALVSTTVETADPMAELAMGIDLLGPIDARFASISDIYEPTGDGSADGVYITTSYDATSHFETTCDDVLAIYQRITGHPVDFAHPPQPGEVVSETPVEA